MGREQGHRVHWPCSKIPALGWEQPPGWLEKQSRGTKLSLRAWLHPQPLPAGEEGRALPTQSIQTPPGSLPQISGLSPPWVAGAATLVPLAAMGQEQLSQGVLCPGHGMLRESQAGSCSWKMEGKDVEAALGELTTKKDTNGTLDTALLYGAQPRAHTGGLFRAAGSKGSVAQGSRSCWRSRDTNALATSP